MNTYSKIAEAWRRATLAIEIPPPPLRRVVRVRDAVERLIAAGDKRAWQGGSEPIEEWAAAGGEARAAVQALNISGGRT